MPKKGRNTPKKKSSFGFKTTKRPKKRKKKDTLGGIIR